MVRRHKFRGGRYAGKLATVAALFGVTVAVAGEANAQPTNIAFNFAPPLLEESMRPGSLVMKTGPAGVVKRATPAKRGTGPGVHVISCPAETGMVVDLKGAEPGAKFKIDGCYCGTDADIKADLDDIDKLSKTLTAGLSGATASAAVRAAVLKVKADINNNLNIMNKAKSPYEFSVDPKKPGPSTLSRDVRCISKSEVQTYYSRKVLSPALEANAKFKIDPQ